MARGKAKQEAQQAGSFVVLMTALATLLLAFFILLNSISVKDDNRQRLAIGSLLGSFGILPGGVQFEPGKSLMPPQAPILNPEDEGLKASLETFRRLGMKVKAWSGDPADEATSEDEVISREENVAISLGSSLLFLPGGATLKPQAYTYLDAVAGLALQTTNNIVVEGHTDNVPPQGGLFPTSWELSGARAVEVLRYLERRGVAARRLMAVGRGAEHPIDTNDVEEGRVRNRRVEIRLVGPLRKRNVKQRLFDFKGFTFSTTF
ncbi:MAG: OmpA family protein [Candidatus Tectomicrobia bacterium]|nr:OmpA family protein [Candidatus Tectomicrobia bacterium]